MLQLGGISGGFLPYFSCWRFRRSGVTSTVPARKPPGIGSFVTFLVGKPLSSCNSLAVFLAGFLVRFLEGFLAIGRTPRGSVIATRSHYPNATEAGNVTRAEATRGA